MLAGSDRGGFQGGPPPADAAGGGHTLEELSVEIAVQQESGDAGKQDSDMVGRGEKLSQVSIAASEKQWYTGGKARKSALERSASTHERAKIKSNQGIHDQAVGSMESLARDDAVAVRSPGQKHSRNFSSSDQDQSL